MSSFVFSVNNLFNGTGNTITGQFLYTMKTFFVSNGFTIVQSGDGSANFSTSGDVITSNGTGAHGMGNTNAWFVMQEGISFAGQKRQWLVMNSGSGITIAYSYYGFRTDLGVGSGTPSIAPAVQPSGYDPILFTSLTASTYINASALTTYQMPLGVSGNWYGHFCVNTVGNNSWYMCFTDGGGSPIISKFWGYDCLLSPTPGMTDPVVNMYCPSLSGFYAQSTSGLGAFAKYYVQPLSEINSKAAALASVYNSSTNAYLLFPSFCGGSNASKVCAPNPISGSDTVLPAYYILPLDSNTTGSGILAGQSSLFLMHAPARQFPSYFNVNGGTNNYISMDQGSTYPSTLMPWNNTTISS